MIRLIAALLLILPLQARAQQQAMVIRPGDTVVIPPRSDPRPKFSSIAEAPLTVPRLAPQGPARWSASPDALLTNPWLLAPLAATAAALALLLPGGGGSSGGASAGAGLSAGTATR
jgi:hypothetical protein